jgi:hypothetical protein
MSKPNILIQLDSDARPSVFDAVVAVDASVDRLLQYGGVTPENVRELVHGAMFTRGPDDLKHTAIFIGGSNVAAGEALLAAVTATFFGPMRVSVLMDANGANTTAAAAVLAAARHVSLAGTTALVLAATGPVGNRAARLLAREGAAVRLSSRNLARSQAAASALSAVVEGARLSAWQASNDAELAAALDGVEVVIAAGAAGAMLFPSPARRAAANLKVAIDLNAVPPLGIEGIKATDKAAERDGVIAYGALGVGGTKMKIHKEAIRRLFTASDLVLDAEQALAIGKEVGE